MKLIPWARRDAASGRALVPLQNSKEIEMDDHAENVVATPVDPVQEVMMQAAAAHHRSVAERTEMIRMLDEANAALKMKNEQIMEFQLALAEERNRVSSYRSEADEHVRENARLGEGLVNVKATLAMLVAQLEALALPPPPEKRRRRKSNGDHSRDVGHAAVSEAVPDAGGGQGEVAGEPPVVAHRAPLLGQQTEF